MNIIRIINNLRRLNFINILRFLMYKLKKKFKVEPTKAEKHLSAYYTYLVKYDGFLIKETNTYYITNFKSKFCSSLKLRKSPSSDFNVFYQIIESKEYLPVVTDYKKNFENLENYPLNIIDAGSNIGLTSLFFMEHFQRARIIAVEPDLTNFEILSYNLREKINFEIIKINGAVWSSNSKIKVVNDFRDKSDWSFRVEESNDINSIQAYTINDLANKNNFNFIDILKIDVEGAEKQIFTATDSNLEFLNKTRCIAIEIHDEFECREEIYCILENYGFTIYNEGESLIGINQNLRVNTINI